MPCKVTSILTSGDEDFSASVVPQAKRHIRISGEAQAKNRRKEKPRSTSFRTEIVNGKRQIQCHSISLIHFQKGDLRGDDSSVKDRVPAAHQKDNSLQKETAATRQSQKTISFPTEFQILSLKGHLCVDDSSVSCEQQGAHQQGTIDK
uniref:SLF2 protein n=1 Tax=Caenorhabditis tropicalis TaxID=1561998 RepID=A0A1I7TCF1_9PELO